MTVCVKELTALLEQGLSYTQCGKQLGVSRQRIHQLAETYNLSKIWKKKGNTSLEQKKAKFNLSDEYFAICSLRFTRKRQNCKAMGIPFELEFQDIFWPTHCPILGMQLDYYGESGFRLENSPSFDKINPKLGYVKGNVQIVSWRANRIKNDGTAEEHRRIAEYLDKHDIKNIPI